MCATCVDVFVTVDTALVSLMYLSVNIITNWAPVLVLGSDPSISMAPNSNWPSGGKRGSDL